jgi:outer membrane protein assembly factor BamB
MFGLLQLDGTRIWGQGPKAGTPAILPGIGDANGDGRLELLSPGHCGKGKESLLKCHDARTGKVNWQLPLPGRCFGANNGFVDSTPMTPAVADLNGDGRDEAVFAIDSTLMAVGEIAGRGAVLWKLDFPGKLGPVAIADVAGNDSPQMLVVCEDGFLYGLGGPAGKP